MTQKTKWVLTALLVAAIAALAICLVRSPRVDPREESHAESTESAEVLQSRED